MFRYGKTLSLYELVSLLKGELAKAPSLQDVIRALCTHRGRSRTFRHPSADPVFHVLQDLSISKAKNAEEAIALRNRPPSPGEKVSPQLRIWALVSWVVFQLNPLFSKGFAEAVIDGCLLNPTDMVFALVHSEAIASLAANHPPVRSASLIEICISNCDDSRAIYSIRLARWLADWSELRRSVFTAMLKGSPTKRVEAMWLVNDRSNVAEALSFADENRIDVPALLRTANDLKSISRLILNSSGGVPSQGVPYAIRANTGPVSPDELEAMSDRIRRLLENE